MTATVHTKTPFLSKRCVRCVKMIIVLTIYHMTLFIFPSCSMAESFFETQHHEIHDDIYTGGIVSLEHDLYIEHKPIDLVEGIFDTGHRYEPLNETYESLNNLIYEAEGKESEYNILILKNESISLYENVTHFLFENLQLYIDFHAANPEFDVETVIWKVNVFLHLPHYSYIRITNENNPLLVNPYNRLPNGFEPVNLIPIHEGSIYLATPETVLAFQKMSDSAASSGMRILPDSGSVLPTFGQARRSSRR